MAFYISGIVFDELSADPGSPVEGQVWYNTTEKRFKVYRNGAVEALLDKDEFDAHLADLANPHSVGLEQARQAYSTLSGTIDMDSNRILNVGDPTVDGDAVNKLYADSYINGTLVSGTPTDGQHFTYDVGNGVWTFADAADVTGGANVGVGGVGVFDGENAGILEFKSINSDDDWVDVVDDAANNEIDINVNNDLAVWNADRLQGFTVASGITPAQGQVLTYSGGNWVPQGTQGAGISASAKAGQVLEASFAGNPKLASVAFSTAYGDTNYAITLTAETSGNSNFSPAVENVTAAGFDINMGTNNTNNLISVRWITMPFGEG